MIRRNHYLCQLFGVLLTIVLLFLSSGLLTANSDSSIKNILIINSYHKGLLWTDQETEGILYGLGESGLDLSISIEYMDWKRYPTEENLKQIYNQLKYKYSQQNIDIVLTSDDAALEFTLKNRADLFSDAPVVFCGVNEEGADRLTEGYNRVTGVLEIIDPTDTLKAALPINPGLKEIYVIYDNSESGLSTGAIAVQAIKSLKPAIKINTMNEMNLKELLTEVGKAPADSIILMTTYYMDSQGTVTGFENIVRKVSEASKVPVYHIYDFGLGNGTVGGRMLSGKNEGERAGRIAARVLNGEVISDIPVETLGKLHYKFDYEQLIRFNIPLDKIPRDSEIINKPFSFFEAYKSLVIMAGLIFSLLVIFIAILLYYLGKISRMKSQLKENNEDLVQSEHKLRMQYNELVRVQQELSSSEERYSLLFMKMLNGFYVLEPVFNADGKIIDIRFLKTNPAIKAHTGLSAEDITGKTWMEVYNYPNKNLQIYHNILRTGKPRHFETYYPQDNTYYLINAFKAADNQIGVVFDNITEYKQAIKEITTLNEELEHRVAERTDELQSVVEELEAFTYTVSHDLKSPLRAVDGYSRLLLEDFGSKLEEEAAVMVQNIRGICTDMIEMISRLLEYSITSKAAIDKELISIETIFKAVFSELLPLNPGRSIKLIVETGLPEVFADRVMLKQVIHNLLSNAVKFTRHREQAIISVGCTITGEEYVFYIRDNGAGFDMEYSKKLFGIFQRLHTSDEFEGSGIGLVTVKRIIQKHGGRVWIEGKADHGAAVYFTLPMEW